MGSFSAESVGGGGGAESLGGVVRGSAGSIGHSHEILWESARGTSVLGGMRGVTGMSASSMAVGVGVLVVTWELWLLVLVHRVAQEVLPVWARVVLLEGVYLVACNATGVSVPGSVRTSGSMEGVAGMNVSGSRVNIAGLGRVHLTVSEGIASLQVGMVWLRIVQEQWRQYQAPSLPSSFHRYRSLMAVPTWVRTENLRENNLSSLSLCQEFAGSCLKRCMVAGLGVTYVMRKSSVSYIEEVLVIGNERRCTLVVPGVSDMCKSTGGEAPYTNPGGWSLRQDES